MDPFSCSIVTNYLAARKLGWGRSVWQDLAWRWHQLSFRRNGQESVRTLYTGMTNTPTNTPEQRSDRVRLGFHRCVLFITPLWTALTVDQ